MNKESFCKGSWALGTACGRCQRCLETRPTSKAPPSKEEIEFAIRNAVYALGIVKSSGTSLPVNLQQDVLETLLDATREAMHLDHALDMVEMERDKLKIGLKTAADEARRRTVMEAIDVVDKALAIKGWLLVDRDEKCGRTVAKEAILSLIAPPAPVWCEHIQWHPEQNHWRFAKHAATAQMTGMVIPDSWSICPIFDCGKPRPEVCDEKAH